MKCPICNGTEVISGLTSLTLTREAYSFTLTAVPAMVCPDCGEAYLDEDTASSALMMATEVETEGWRVGKMSFLNHQNAENPLFADRSSS